MSEAMEDLFGYNRGNFFYDQKMRIEREYQEQDMRIKQFLLYREDVRDLSELTVKKMDSYLLITLLEIGGCLDMLMHGVLHIGERENDLDPPTWLLWLYVISLAEAFVYLFLSAWLAIHASVSAHSFSVRLLTQFVRLPIASKDQMNAASAVATEYEGYGVDMLRVPMWQKQAARLATTDDASESLASQDSAVAGLALAQQANPAAALKHVRLYRDLQNNWQAHDAYARACLALGTYKMIHALAYYTIGLLVIELRAPWAGLGCALVLPMLAWLLIRLDLYFASYMYVIGALLLMTGPLFALLAATMRFLPEPFKSAHQFLVPVIFAMHAVLIVCIEFVARAEKTSESRGAALPTRFRSVLYLDVFGWMTSPEEPEVAVAPAAGRETGRSVDSSDICRALSEECNGLGAQLLLEFRGWEVTDLRQLGLTVVVVVVFYCCCCSFASDGSGVCEGEEEGGSWIGEALPPSAQAGSSSACSGGRLSSEECAVVWLRLEWHLAPPAQGSISWYVQPGTSERFSNNPEGPGVFVSDLDGVTDRVDQLRERIDALATAAREARSMRGSRGSRFSRVRRAAGAVNQPLSSPLLDSVVDEAPASQAQETRFGGRESVDVGAVAAGDATWSYSETAAQTFHPRRDDRRESRRPPGQVPWRIFLNVSGMLVSVWVVGVAWYAITPLSMLVGTGGKATLQGELGGSGRRVLSGDSWPARPVPVRPVGMVCHAQQGGRLLVAERFAVYEIDLVPTSHLQQSAEVHECLAHEPQFHSEGLAAISLECSDPGSCWLLLLGSRGAEVLRCPLGPGQSSRPRLVRLDGGPSFAGFRAIMAAPPQQHSGSSQKLATGGHRWWGVPKGGSCAAPVQLRVQFGSRPIASAQKFSSWGRQHEEVVELYLTGEVDWAESEAGRRTLRMADSSLRQAAKHAVVQAGAEAHALQGIGRQSFLGLSDGGLDSEGPQMLHTWTALPDGRFRHAAAWGLPEGRSWTAGCSAHGHFWALGGTDGAMGPELWSFDLPEPL
ncbi:unnamed protein product, partial [Polarella glacialis]